MGSCRGAGRPVLRSLWWRLAGGLVILVGGSLVSPAASLACSNDAFRVGPSATLPDCRAYELVTPPDSKGRRFIDLTSEPQLFDLFTNELASPIRDSFLFGVRGSALRE